MRVVIALGGNALLQRFERPDAQIQRQHVRVAAEQLAPVIAEHDAIICHGNGPQIGMLALESDADVELTRPFPLDTLGAQTQGMIGYWLAQELANAGVGKPIAVLLTQTLVDERDPAFDRPTKFIGRSYTEAEAGEVARNRGWSVALDGSSWRRVVPSPDPLRIIELPTIRHLADVGTLVVCAGGGGAPVIADRDGWIGMEAVVDKDLTAALLAIEVAADRLVLLTDVDAVKTDFGTRNERSLTELALADVEQMSFPTGSMGPKVAACARFVEATGRPAVIGALDRAAAVVAGTSGTTISTTGHAVSPEAR